MIRIQRPYTRYFALINQLLSSWICSVKVPTTCHLLCQNFLAINPLIFISINQKVFLGDFLSLQGCAHEDIREMQGIILPLRNLQMCGPGVDKLFSLKVQTVTLFLAIKDICSLSHKCESSYRQYINKQACLCSNETWQKCTAGKIWLMGCLLWRIKEALIELYRVSLVVQG